jgi:hypothetical protein
MTPPQREDQHVSLFKEQRKSAWLSLEKKRRSAWPLCKDKRNSACFQLKERRSSAERVRKDKRRLAWQLYKENKRSAWPLYKDKRRYRYARSIENQHGEEKREEKINLIPAQGKEKTIRVSPQRYKKVIMTPV